MDKKELLKTLEEWLEDIDSGAITEMDIPDLDLYQTDKEKTAFIAGMKLIIESILNIA